ncbi:hypothetical protein L9F63_001831 [Diploptera punctata]|uniref:U8 snoRNA-decapping enzyme n=1 Tax=Diploptera punctata TaxID=6984 RepID=A0AAD8A4I3_DIPPU|nr:hypothetical protein L9F63_001831 [Diploptera punctata]
MSDMNGDGSWGHLADTEHFGRECSTYIEIPKGDLNLPKYSEVTNAGHCMIYARSNDRIFGLYNARATVLMQMRFDGYLGFPGGLIDEGENVIMGLNRELVEEMHLDVHKYPVKEGDYVVSHWAPSKKLLLHFYALEVAIDDLKRMEASAIQAHDYGTETLGTIRLPLYTMGDGYRGFPAFLSNSFAGNSREQLLRGLVHANIMTAEEIARALEAKPAKIITEKEENS